MKNPIPFQMLLDEPEKLKMLLPQMPSNIPSNFTPLKSGSISMSLAPYAGEWGTAESAHLLRRTITGPAYADIIATSKMNVETAVDMLTRDLDDPEPPVYYDYERDPVAGLGETWVNKHYQIIGRDVIIAARNRSLAGWTARRIRDHQMNVREKMVIFWHNHLVVGNFNDPNAAYGYNTTLRRHALGNAKQLVKDITIDPSMLLYLNGNENNVEAPNENYARELLELFTVGKGQIAGEGDYTTFTEDDVRAMARSLTGWVVRGLRSVTEGDTVRSLFVERRHDRGEKQLSHRFNNAVISNSGENEYSDLIDIIFESRYAATYLARELYLWFVYYDITPEIQESIVNPLADIIREDGFDVKRAIQTLLKSDHFYSYTYQGAMIKNPIEFTIGFLNTFGIDLPNENNLNYFLDVAVHNFTGAVQMAFYGPPDVAGWKAWYQEPVFYQHWINSVTIELRNLYTILLTSREAAVQGQSIAIKVLDFVEQLSNPEDINVLLDDLAMTLTIRPFSEEQKIFFKALLIPGLPDFEWTEEYLLWKADPENLATRVPLENKLYFLFAVITFMPEFQLS